MPPVSHQTIKLSRGRHSSAEHGACVMELASMLAGEGFSDHPRSVSRPIASFLRGYNDLVDDRRREDLYGYAARAVGTADCGEIEEARAARLLAWADALWERRSARSLLQRMRMRRVHKERATDPEPAGTYAVHAIGKVNDETARRGAGARRRADRDGRRHVGGRPGARRPRDDRRAVGR